MAWSEELHALVLVGGITAIVGLSTVVFFQSRQLRSERQRHRVDAAKTTNDGLDEDEALDVAWVPPDEGSDSDEDINQPNGEQVEEQIEAEHGFPLAEPDDGADRLSHQIPSIAYIIGKLRISFAVATDNDDKIAAFLEDQEHQTRHQEILRTRVDDKRVSRFYAAAITAIRTFTIRILEAECKKLCHFLKVCSEASKDQTLGTESIDTTEGEDLDPILEELVESWKWATHDILNIQKVHKPLFWLLGGAFKRCVDGCLIATSGTASIGPVLETLKRDWTVGANYHNSLWNFIIGAIMEKIKTDNQQTKEDMEKLVRLLASNSEIHVLGRVQNLLTSNTEDEFCVMFAFGWELRRNIKIVENDHVYAKLEEGNWTIRPDLLELFHPTEADQESRTVDSSTQTQPINTASRIDLSPDQPASKASSENYIEEFLEHFSYEHSSSHFLNSNEALHPRKIEKLKLIRKYTYKDPDNLQKHQLNIRAINIKNEEAELGEVVYYYLTRGEEPHTSIQSVILQSYFDSQTDYQQMIWVEMCCVILSTQPAHFYKRFDNIMAIFQDIFDKQPQLLMCKGSDGLLEKLVEYLPHDDLRLIISKIRDENGMTCMFHVNEYRSYVVLYDNQAEDLYKLLSTCDIKGQTALHVNTQPITQLLSKYAPEHAGDLYRLLSISDNEGQTALHIDIDNIPPLLTNVYTPKHADDLWKLLSIRNNNDQTALHVNPSENILHFLSTKIYESNQADHLFKLLSLRDNNGQTAVHVNTQSITQLITTIYNPEHAGDLYELLSIQDNNGDTALHVNTQPITQLLTIIYTPERAHDLYVLLSILSAKGRTALHVNTQPITQLLSTIYAPEHAGDLYRLLSISDKEGQTALHIDRYNIPHLLTIIYTPDQADDLWMLLSIGNNNNQTALHVNSYLITQFITTVYTREHTDHLYDLLSVCDINGQTVLHTDRYNIPHLLTIIYTPDQADDLWKLILIRNNNNQTALHVNTYSITQFITTVYTQEHTDHLYNLLSIRDINGQTALHTDRLSIHHLLTIIYTSKRTDDLWKLLSIRNNNNQTALHVNAPPITQFITTVYTQEHAGDLYRLLSISDIEGQTALHVDRGNIPHLLTNVYTPKHADDLWKLLSIQNNKNQTVLHVNPSENILHFLSTKIYNSNQDHLFKLLSLRDNNGQTAVDVNRERITRFMAAVIKTPKQQELFFKLISMRNPEAVLIIYNSNNRPRAEEEAQTIYNACKSRYYREVALEKNKPEHEIIDLIKYKANNPNTKSLIVILMSTGAVGTIDDCDGNPIELSDIEAAMCSDILDGTPKILITQCNSCSAQEVDMKLNAYQPTHPDFCAVMSFVAEEEKHKQGLFLEKLADHMENSREDINIFKQLKNVSSAMGEEKHPQTPIIMSTLDAEFCPPVAQL